MKAIKIENRKELKTYTIGRNCTSQKIETSVFVIFENNASMKLQAICREIGNHFGWSEADKMKKSKSEKTIIEFINKYQSFVSKYIS
jgi:hypothetical protein